MKKHLFFCLSLLVLLTACGKSDDVEQTVAPVTPESPTNPDTPGNPDENPDTNPDTPSTPGDDLSGHEYVDLGLPSGTLWATTNVGAASPADYGDYFAWGETAPKTNYDWSTYKWCNGSETTLTKYCTSSDYGTVDNKTVLEAADDAATANWGSAWRMPTHEEQQELLNGSYCTWTWTSQTNSKGETINGYEVKSASNGNTLFLPAAGFRGGTSMNDAGSEGTYWSSLLSSHPGFVCNLHFISGSYYESDYRRICGQPVRPVRALARD